MCRVRREKHGGSCEEKKSKHSGHKDPVRKKAAQSGGKRRSASASAAACYDRHLAQDLTKNQHCIVSNCCEINANCEDLKRMKLERTIGPWYCVKAAEMFGI